MGGAVWVGVALAVAGLALLSGVSAGDPVGDLLVLAGSAAYSLQIVLMERYAPRYDPVAFTQAEMLAAFAGFAVVAVALGQVELPRGWTVWSALLVTGIFASALAFLVQTWAQRRASATQTALAFAMEPVFAGFFGFWLAGDRLGAVGWGGCALIMAGIVVAEPEQADVRAALARRQMSQAPSRCTTSPSRLSSPPERRSLTMSQCTALSFFRPCRCSSRHGEVDGSVHLLVEENVAREAGDPRIAAEAELAEAARAVVRREDLLQELLALVGARLDDLAGTEDEPRPDDVVAEVDGRELRVGDHALGAVLQRAVEHLAVGHVAEAGGDDAVPAFDPDREVGSVSEDADRASPVEVLLDLPHARFLGVPVEQAGVENEVGVLLQRHPCLFGRGRVGTRRSPSAHRGCAHACLRAPSPAAAADGVRGRARRGVDVLGERIVSRASSCSIA